MNDTTDHRLHSAHPLSILMDCPVPGCTGRISLHSAGRHHPRAVGRCPACAGSAILRAGVLEPDRRQVARAPRQPAVNP